VHTSNILDVEAQVEKGGGVALTPPSPIRLRRTGEGAGIERKRKRKEDR
jgi:hypothetical protein